jgi:hypothetical protein
MVSVFTELQGLDLESGLKGAIAQILPITDPETIPLSLSFQRPGLGFRSALLLKTAAQQQQPISHYLVSTQQQFTNHSVIVLPHTPWLFTTQITAKGWLEFQLQPQSLAQWLDACRGNIRYLIEHLDVGGKDGRRSPHRDPFPWQYLHHRCRSLLALAQEVYPQLSPAWYFTPHRIIPPWEQTLLDAIARLLLALIQASPTTQRFAAVADTFWETHRHCALYAFPQADPILFSHYCRWYSLIEQLFGAYLQQVGADLASF